MKKLLLALALFWPGFAFGQSIGSPSVPTSFSSLCPGASNGQVLYDNNGACGGITGVTTNGTTTFVFGSGVTVTGPDSGTWTSAGLNSIVGIGVGTTASTGSIAIAQGTITTNIKALNITTSWNAVGTTFDAPLFINVTNTASAAASLLADFQIGGSTAIGFTSLGAIYAGQGSDAPGTVLAVFNLGDISVYSGHSIGSSANRVIGLGGDVPGKGMSILPSACYEWSSSTSDVYGNIDTAMCRQGAGVAQISTSGSSPNASGSLLLTNLTASGTTNSAAYEVGGTSGAACTAGTVISSITVVSGIVTAITGTGC